METHSYVTTLYDCHTYNLKGPRGKSNLKIIHFMWIYFKNRYTSMEARARHGHVLLYKFVSKNNDVGSVFFFSLWTYEWI